MSNMYEELAMQLMSGEVEGSSAYKLRNENIQQKVRMKRIPRLKRDLKKMSKLMIPLELAFPFNPQTGEADDTFNEDNKYRPLRSPTVVAIAMKHMAKQNPALKEALMKRARIESWDLDNNIDELNETDKQIFRLYRVPRIFTLSVVAVNDSRVTGRDWGIEYTISVKRNDLGQIEGEWPLALQANKFYRELAYEEAEHIKQCVEAARNGKPYELKSNAKGLKGMDLASITDEDLKDALRDDVYSKIAISEDYPANYLVVYEFPLTGDMSIANPDSYKTLAVEELDSMMRITKVTKEINTGLDKYRTGTYHKNDRHYDYWELDMTCPTTYDGDSPERDIPKETRYEGPVNRLFEEDFYDELLKCMTEHQNDLSDLEPRFLNSIYVKKFDESVERKILESIELNNELENPFLTDAVIRSNADFINKVYGDEGAILVASVDAGVAEVSEGVLDADEAAKVSKLNLQDVLDSADGDGGEETTENSESQEDSEDSGETVEGEVISVMD